MGLRSRFPAFIEHIQDDLSLMSSRNVNCSHATSRVYVLDVGVVSQKQFYDVHVVIHHGSPEWSVPFIFRRIDVGLAFHEEELNCVGLTAMRCHVQRSNAIMRPGRFDVCAKLDQHVDDMYEAKASCNPERRHTIGFASIHRSAVGC